jgi:hypothetical protein
VAPKKKTTITDKIFGFLSSLKVAVVIVLLLAAALSTGTVLESVYDTPSAQYWVYRALWFKLLLSSLGVNIFAVMVDRWPWKKQHLPFLLAHIGILVLLAGSWTTDKFGLDGMMRVTEGQTEGVVELSEASLVVVEGDKVRKMPITWTPPNVEFRPIDVRKEGLPYNLTVDRFLSHADPQYSFIPPAPGTPARPTPLPAAKLRMKGGPMRITQEFWLWAGDRSFKSVQMGPASFAIGADAPMPPAGRPGFTIQAGEGGAVKFRSQPSEGKPFEGTIAKTEARDHKIDLKWKGNVELTILEWVPDAEPKVTYEPARVQYGQTAPSAAVHVISGKGGENAEAWLGLGDRAVLHTESGNVDIGYLPQRVVLPFGVRLDRFSIERYEGSFDPSSYSSRVSVFAESTDPNAAQSVTISMNEPLTVKGITLYQASYEDARPRPVISIFSVNRDPGRPWKYLGSLLLVFGSIVLFASKYKKGRQANAAPTPTEKSSAASNAANPAAAPSEVS